MNKRKSCVGIDVSKDTFNAHWKGCDRKYKNGRKGWQALLKEAPPDSCFAMEATGNYHYKIAAYLHSKGSAVMVYNPLHVRRWVQSLGIKAKTDKADARVIAAFAQRKDGSAKPWKPLSPRHSRARLIVSLLRGLSRISNSAGNLNHAAKLVTHGKDSLLDVMDGVKSFCSERQESLEAELYGIAEELFPESFRLLTTVPGIGRKSAAVMLVACNGLEGFETHGNLSSFIGLTPSVCESGTSVRGKGRTSKVGNSYLRSLLFMSAFTAARACEPCSSLFNRLTAKGKPKKVAYVAVMHRLVKIAFGVLKSGEPYRGGALSAKKNIIGSAG